MGGENPVQEKQYIKHKLCNVFHHIQNQNVITKLHSLIWYKTIADIHDYNPNIGPTAMSNRAGFFHILSRITTFQIETCEKIAYQQGHISQLSCSK